jgi:hypothetical protein
MYFLVQSLSSALSESATKDTSRVAGVPGEAEVGGRGMRVQCQPTSMSDMATFRQLTAIPNAA